MQVSELILHQIEQRRGQFFDSQPGGTRAHGQAHRPVAADKYSYNSRSGQRTAGNHEIILIDVIAGSAPEFSQTWKMTHAPILSAHRGRVQDIGS